MSERSEGSRGARDNGGYRGGSQGGQGRRSDRGGNGGFGAQGRDRGKGPGGSSGRVGAKGRGGSQGRGGKDERKFKSNRGGRDRNHGPHSNPQRPGYREERITKRINEPQIPADIDPKDLDPDVRQELRSLSKDNADMVAKHLIMTALTLDKDPSAALEHARAAKDRAGRVAVSRETCGIAAYHAGEWKEAISELRAARRMSGGPGLLPVLADAERALGKPCKALEVAAEPGAEDLDAESAVELAIVVAGAHQDLEEYQGAVAALASQLENSDAPDVTRMRLFYAYADALELAGDVHGAKEWFTTAAEMDTEELLDTESRLERLNGPDSPNASTTTGAQQAHES